MASNDDGWTLLLIAQLHKRYGTDGEVPTFPLTEWRRKVVWDETRLGYWEWVAWMIDQGHTRGLTQHTFSFMNEERS